MKTVSVVVPVYYNAESLPLLFAELQKVEHALHERDCAMELIFVDDGSGDESMIELLKIKQQRPDTQVVKLARNFGAVHSSKVGLNYVTGDCFMWLAADLQDPPELVVEMTDQWLAGSKFVIALRESRVDPPLTRLFAAVYHWLVRAMISKDYPKGGFDIALMDAALVPYIRDSSKNINTALLAYWLGYKPATLYYERRERPHGKSRWTFAKKLTYFIDSILGFSVLPIRLISMLGFIVSLLSFGYGLYIVAGTVFGGRVVAGFATLVALISFLLGAVMIILGIIGEYIWRIFDEVTTRPEVVVEHVY
ncbi:glycosyl transferase [Mycobacterium asiaticum]|uniref:glycosyltransferase n=1 Tax=Mycobacterium asiaticum TaxID=1790 RepID=UPI0007F01AF4|nr:glycosyltransferase [Mycobacterium asiaticum]OBK96584.1 glycosyl transferase [Mycobacterium asiaticum]